MTTRRGFLAGGAAALTFPAPRLALAADAKVLKFVPQADLAVVDPIWTTATVTRNHAFMVFDTLFGQDETYQAAAADGGRARSPMPTARSGRITLRDGLQLP